MMTTGELMIAPTTITKDAFQIRLIKMEVTEDQ